MSEQRDAGNYIVSASEFFENEVANGNAFGEKEDIFFFGDIAPDWSSAVVRTDYASDLRSVECKLSTSYGYRIIGMSSDSLRLRRIMCQQRLLVAENMSDGSRGAFVLLYVPDRTRLLSRRIPDGGTVRDFTGMKIYCTLDGHIFRVNMYEGGRKVSGFSFRDLVERGHGTDAAESFKVLESIRVQRGVARVTTRSSMDTELDASYCWGDVYHPFDDPYFWFGYYDNQDAMTREYYPDPDPLPGGGGGGSRSTVSQVISPTNRQYAGVNIFGGSGSQVEKLLKTLNDERVKDYKPIVNLFDKLDKNRVSIRIMDKVMVNGREVRMACKSPDSSDKIVVQVNAAELGDQLSDYHWEIYEELLHAYQYQESATWKTGDRELEAKVWISLLDIKTDIYFGLEHNTTINLYLYYKHPNKEKNFRKAYEILTGSPFYYNGNDYPLTSGMSNKERLKHITSLF